MTQNGHSDIITEGIRVQVGAQYQGERSRPELGQYFFVYRVVISNVGEEPAKLLSRHWLITDADNERHEVQGPGVVGEHPDLSPGSTFSYVSFCPLATPWGTMEGSFTMARPDGRRFDAEIGRFFLATNLPPLSGETETP